MRTAVSTCAIALVLLAGSAPASADEPSGGTGNRIVMVVSVPTEDAELQVQGAVTKTTGKVRRLTSPPLTAGKLFTYEFKATWKADGQTHSKEASIKAQVGQTVNVDLTLPEAVAKAPEPKKEADPVKPVEPKKEPEAKKDPTPKKEPEPVKPVEGKKEPELVKSVEPKKEEVKKDPTPAKVSETKPGPSAKPELALNMPSQLTVRAGGYTKILPIRIKREGFEGPISVKFDKLPVGMTLADATIPAGADEADVEAVIAADAPTGDAEVKVTAEADKAKSEFTLKVTVSGK